MGTLSLTERDGSITLSLEDARRVLPVRLQGGETFWLDVEAPSDEEASVMRELTVILPPSSLWWAWDTLCIAGSGPAAGLANPDQPLNPDQQPASAGGQIRARSNG